MPAWCLGELNCWQHSLRCSIKPKPEIFTDLRDLHGIVNKVIPEVLTELYFCMCMLSVYFTAFLSTVYSFTFFFFFLLMVLFVHTLKRPQAEHCLERKIQGQVVASIGKLLLFAFFSPQSGKEWYSRIPPFKYRPYIVNVKGGMPRMQHLQESLERVVTLQYCQLQISTALDPESFQRWHISGSF